MHRCLALLLALLPGWLAGRGNGAGDALQRWSAKVQPLLESRCTKCHGLIERKGGLELVSLESTLKGGDDGVVVKPGDPAGSRLYQVLGPDADPHMPPKKQLTEGEIDAVRDWIVALGVRAESRVGEASGGRETGSFHSIPEAVDAWIPGGGERVGVAIGGPVADRTWCRRVYLDLVGRIPTVAEVESFGAGAGVERREALVDRLLASPEYPVRMRELWDVFLMGRAKRDNHDERRRQKGWWSYLEQVFATNQAWNVTVRQMIAARPTTPEAQGSTWFLYERRNDYQAMAEAVAPLVYGTKIDCAQCHDHPLAREIRQEHYWGLVAAFNRSKNVEGGTEIGESAIGGFVNFTNLRKESQPAVMALLTGRRIDEVRPSGDAKEEDRGDRYVDPGAKVRVPRFSRREALAGAVTEGNPLLARAFVNRMWAVLMGRGLVEPVDEMNARHVPSHPGLLDWLARDFEAHGYDIKRLVRGLILSRYYALDRGGVRVAGGGGGGPAAARERPMTAEQIARSWRVAAGLEPVLDEPLRRGVAAAIPDVLAREYQATFQQAQFLSHSPLIAGLLRPGQSNVVDRLAGVPGVRRRVEEAFLAVLGRLPDSEEAVRFAGYLEDRSGRPAEGVRDMMWALMTSAEFLTLP